MPSLQISYRHRQASDASVADGVVAGVVDDVVAGENLLCSVALRFRVVTKPKIENFMALQVLKTKMEFPKYFLTWKTQLKNIPLKIEHRRLKS